MKDKMNFKVYLGMAIIVAIFTVALLAPVISPYDPYALGIPYQRPSTEHFLGTNDIGQDILSELIYGTRVSLLIGTLAAFVVTVVGSTVGLVSGYYGKTVDKILMQITNVFMSIPDLPLTIVLVAFLSASVWNLIIAICITAWTGTARIIRSKVLQIKELPFVKIEKTMGAKDHYIIFKHILPNVTEIIFTRGVLSVVGAMLTEASLSFLGLGVIGTKSWGGILHYAFFRSGIINGAYWWYLPPILCISLSAFGFLFLSYYGEKKYTPDVKRKAR